ncbi:MAG: type II toxin-antitoxin system HicB family antitoxin [Syntrophomonadaceae bacterium]
MTLTLVVTKTDDGFTGEVPTIKGCESWAHDLDTAIDKTLDMVAFYLKLEQAYFAMDMIRKSGNKTFYKIIFNKK